MEAWQAVNTRRELSCGLDPFLEFLVGWAVLGVVVSAVSADMG
jgi:hypothetical protein